MPSVESDRDRPAGAGALAALQLCAGRVAVTVANLLRPRLSLGVRLLALDQAGRVFLVRHSYLPGLHLPGGGVDAGESSRAAVMREAREEGGLTLHAPPDLFHVYWNRALGARDHVLLFVARDVGPPGLRTARLEIVGTGFHDPRQLPADVTPATRARISEVLDGTAPSETW